MEVWKYQFHSNDLVEVNLVCRDQGALSQYRCLCNHLYIYKIIIHMSIDLNGESTVNKKMSDSSSW